MKIDPKTQLSAVIKQNPNVTQLFNSYDIDCTSQSNLDKSVEQLIFDNNLNMIDVFSQIDKLSYYSEKNNFNATNTNGVNNSDMCDLCKKSKIKHEDDFLLYNAKSKEFFLVTIRRCQSCKYGGILYWSIVTGLIIILLFTLYSLNQNGVKTRNMMAITPIILGLEALIMLYIIPALGIKNPLNFIKHPKMLELLVNNYKIVFVESSKKQHNGLLVFSLKGVFYSPIENIEKKHRFCSFHNGYKGAKVKIEKAEITNTIKISNAIFKAKRIIS